MFNNTHHKECQGRVKAVETYRGFFMEEPGLLKIEYQKLGDLDNPIN